MVNSNVINSNGATLAKALQDSRLEDNVLQNVKMEIGQDRLSEAELIRKQRLLGIQMIHDPAKSDRMKNGRVSAGEQRSGFVQTRKFYRSRRK